jgi:hypothetical protein
MDIDEALQTARTAVLEMDPALPVELTETAFREVLRHLLSRTSAPAPGKPGAPRTEPTTDTPLHRLAARLRIDPDALADVFDFDGGEARLHVPSSRISATKSQATRDIALLIAAARQGSGLDESWTSSNPIREALANYNRYDQSNFSANLRAAGDVLNIRGKASATEVRLTQPGWEAATTLIRALTGSPS